MSTSMSSDPIIARESENSQRTPLLESGKPLLVPTCPASSIYQELAVKPPRFVLRSASSALTLLLAFLQPMIAWAIFCQ
jgi:hypothetical protein